MGRFNAVLARRTTRTRRVTRRAHTSRVPRFRRGLARKSTKLRTRTRTRTHTTMTKRIKTDNGGPMSNSFFQYPNYLRGFKLGKFKRLTASQFFVSNATQRLDVPIGKQGMLGVSSSGSSQSSPNVYQPLEVGTILSQAELITSTGLSVANANTQRVYMDKVKQELMMTNQTNDVVHVTIYDISARRDIDANSSTGAPYRTPALAWVNGNIDEGSINTWNVVGSTPFQAPGFTENYKIERVTDINLHSGGHHVHRIHFKPNAVFSAEDTVREPNGTLRSWTKFIMVVAHGYAINDSTTKTQISTSAVSIDFIWRTEYEYHVIERSTTNLSISNNLPSSFTVGGEFITDATTVLANTILA